MKIYRNADGRIIATERTINEPVKCKPVDLVIKIFLASAGVGLFYVTKLLLGG